MDAKLPGAPSQAFRPDWAEHWASEPAFAFEQ